MAGKMKPLSEQVRWAIGQSGMSCYRIGKLAGIDKGGLSRFMAGTGGLSMESLDRLAIVLQLRIVAGVKAGKGQVNHGERV